MRFSALAIFLVCWSASGQTLTKRLEAILKSSPEAQGGFWGIRVVDLATGAAVYRRNETQFFVPASNAKLFSTALALMRLGPDHRFETGVFADAKPDEQGRVSEIRLVGGGDPNLSARVLPYKRNALKENAFESLDSLADAVVAAGVRLVDGDVVGDDSAYIWEPFPDGWAADDPVWEYGAPVSALTLNDNAFTLFVDPAASPDRPARLTLWPALEYLTIHNRTRTVLEGDTKLRYKRLPGSQELTVNGTIAIGAKRVKEIMAVDDPALFAAQAFRAALARRGIRITGTARAFHRLTDEPALPRTGVRIAAHTSEPLIEAVRIVNKESQNLHAELLLREAVRVKEGFASRETALEELQRFLKGIGIADKQYNFEDASGLSRLTLVTPLSVTKLLEYMYGTPYRDAWISSLPVGGDDGTLYNRFASNRYAGRIRAKTGTISHVLGLSGYALRKDGRTFAFSILANNYNSVHKPIRAVADRIALALLD